MKNMNDMMKRAASAALAAAMLVSMTACGASSSADETADSDSADDLLTSTAMGLLTSGGHSDESGKQETVYVISNADGSTEKVIDSVHLMNGDGSDTISDVADLSDIENTKGDEDYTDNGDGTITWNAGGSDIYYQGESDADLPLAVSISYSLDGDPVTADELAGQSGHLAITFTYDNKMTEQTEIDGENVTLSRPCAVVSGLLLDNETCSSVTVTNGKAISDGDNVVAVGLAMPGLQESLGLDTLENVDADELDDLLPDSVTVEADVTDFSLTTTLTVVSWDIMDDLDLTGLSDTADDADQSAEDLQEGTEELISGAEELNSYLDELSDGTGDLADGASSLAEGAANAKTGSDTLAAGLATMQTEVAGLPDGTAQLLAGVQALSAALQSNDPDKMGVYEALLAIKSGADQIASGASGIMTGADSIASGANQIAYGASGIMTGAQTIAGGANQLMTGAQAISAGAVSGDASNPGIYEAAQLVEDGLTTAASDLTTSLGTAAGYLYNESGTGSTQLDQAAQTALSGILNGDCSNLTEAQITAIQTALGCVTNACAEDQGVYAGLTGTTLDLSSATTALEGIKSGAQTIAAGAVSGDAENPGIYEGAAAIAAGAVSGDTSNPGIYEAASAINTGALAISAGAKSGDSENPGVYEAASAINTGASTLSSSAATLAAAVAEMNNEDNLGAVESGLQTFCDSSSTLVDGVDQLADGANTLASGLGTLSEGADSLNTGAAQVDSAAGQLADGSSTLLDGINTLNDEGISKIVSLLDGDVTNLYDRIEALKAFADEPLTCSGAADGTDCSTVYIFKTASIG